MTSSRPFRLLFLATMFASMAVVLAWSGWIGWRRWPEWWAVREMRAAVEANEPGRFLDAIERVDSLGGAEAAAEEIAPLGQHPDPRVRMYAVMARTVLGPRGPAVNWRNLCYDVLRPVRERSHSERLDHSRRTGGRDSGSVLRSTDGSNIDAIRRDL